MQTVTLGRTGLKVSAACLGAGGKSRLGQTSGADLSHSVSLVSAALDQGVTILDTAASYGTEPIVGAAVKGRRDKVVISTKLQIHKEGTSPVGTELVDRAELQKRLETSLKALGTDYVDLLHLHAVTPAQYDFCMKEFVPALHDFKAAGKLRFLALTERFAVDSRHAMLERALADDVWDVIMVGFNFLNQMAARAVLPAAKKSNVGTMCMYAVRGPLGKPDTLRALIEKLVASGEIDPADLDAGDPLAFITADGAAISLADAAYRFCRHTPGIDVVITGTGSMAHLKENLQSINRGPLAPTTRRRLEKIFANVWSETGEP